MQDDLYMLDDWKDEWKNRKSFKRRVYSILTFQFLSITSYIGLLTFQHPYDYHQYHHSVVTIVAIVGEIACLLTLPFKRNIVRTGLGSYTILMLQTIF